MKYITLFVLLLNMLFVGCDQQKHTTGVEEENALMEDTLVLELELLHIHGPIASWVTTENKKVFEERIAKGEAVGDSLLYYVVAADSTLPQANGLSECRYRFTGQFYKEMQTMNWEGEPDPAITFRYFKAEPITD